ncbi:MAG: hypothetical protein ACX93N_10935 [Pseudohaliea sp.]
MTFYDVALVVHVLGWVFWLGTDVGVFLGARYAERSDLSVETRLTVLEVGMMLDRAPRFAVPVVWFTGVLLSRGLGYDGITLIPAGVFAVVWLLITWAVIFLAPDTAAHRTALIGQTVFYLVVIFGMGAGSLWLLSSGAIPLWLALKWLGFVLVGIAALLLERMFKPVAALFQQLASEGANRELDARISSTLRPVYPVVLAIYAGTLIAGISGLLKPVW